jgi:hypothetical protein
MILFPSLFKTFLHFLVYVGRISEVWREYLGVYEEGKDAQDINLLFFFIDLYDHSEFYNPDINPLFCRGLLMDDSLSIV